MLNHNRTQTWWKHTSAIPNKWWDVPEIQKRWNKLICGNSSISYSNYVAEKYFANHPSVQLLSIGCGTGQKEIDIAQEISHWRIKGFDLSDSRIKYARSIAQNKGLKNIEFFVNDIFHYDFDPEMYDIILFDSSLHHFSNFTELFRRIKPALSKNGLLIINEYVGPDRFQWTKKQLILSNRLLRKIPAEYRYRWNSKSVKKKIYRPGYLRMVLSDPSEAIHSSEILESLHQNFSIVEEKPLGGNIVQLILKDIAHNFIKDDEMIQNILNDLFREEDNFLEVNQSDFIFGIYNKNESE